MPRVGNKHYPYTSAGKRAAAAARKKQGGGGSARKRVANARAQGKGGVAAAGIRKLREKSR